MISRDELLRYRRYDSALDTAVREIKSTKNNGYLFTLGNSELATLPAEIRNQFGFEFTPVKAFYVGWDVDNVFNSFSCIAIAPVGFHKILIWTGHKSIVVNAEIYAIDRGSAVYDWSIPSYVLPYVASLPSKLFSTPLETRSISKFIGSFDSYSFGRQFGDLFKRKHPYIENRFMFVGSPDIDVYQGFILNELPEGHQLFNFGRLSCLSDRIRNSRWNWAENDKIDETFSVLFECFGDSLLFSTSKVYIPYYCKYKILCLDKKTSGSLCLVLASLKFDKSGHLVVSVTKRDFIEEIRKENDCKLDDIVFYKDAIKIKYIDKEVLYDRAVINEIYGCGVTKKTEQQALATQLTGSGTELELWGDGTLKRIRPNANGVILLPSTVVELGKHCMFFDRNSNIKKIVFNNGIKKISPEFLLLDNSSAALQSVTMCELEYLGDDIDIYAKILSNYLTCALIVESDTNALNLKLYDSLDGRNVFVIASYICAQNHEPTYVGAVPKGVVQNGISKYLSEAGATEVLNIVISRLEKQAHALSKAKYASDKKCADTNNWWNIGRFDLSLTDCKFNMQLYRLCNAYDKHLKTVLSENRQKYFYSRINNLWVQLKDRAELLAQHCLECYERLYGGSASPKSTMNTSLRRYHPAFRDK